MSKKEKKEKKKEKLTVYETVTVDSVMKRMRITVPKNLKEPKTPEPTKKSKKTVKKKKQE